MCISVFVALFLLLGLGLTHFSSLWRVVWVVCCLNLCHWLWSRHSCCISVCLHIWPGIRRTICCISRPVVKILNKISRQKISQQFSNIFYSVFVDMNFPSLVEFTNQSHCNVLNLHLFKCHSQSNLMRNYMLCVFKWSQSVTWSQLEAHYRMCRINKHQCMTFLSFPQKAMVKVDFI